MRRSIELSKNGLVPFASVIARADTGVIVAAPIHPADEGIPPLTDADSIWVPLVEVPPQENVAEEEWPLEEEEEE